MSDIKNVISYFCRYINLLLEWDLDDLAFKSEFMRLAKHNKTDNNVVFHFWLLLSKLEFPKRNFINDVTMVEKVKLNFAFHNYKCVDFYALPDDLNYGSRELLLALMWLISSTDILTKLVEIKLAKSSINYEFPEQYLSNINLEVPNLESQKDYINYISLLIGKINRNIKIRNDCNKKVSENMKKIHLATKYDVDIPHLSISDVYFTKNPEREKQFISDNRLIISLLEAKTKWEECQGIFWKWMSTVVIEKSNDRTVQNDEMTTISNFIELLKKEIHIKPDLLTALSPTNINSDEFNCLDSKRSVVPIIERHVCVAKKKSAYMGPTFSTTVISAGSCKNVISDSKNSQETIFNTSRIAKQIVDRLNSIINKNEMCFR